ncbi:thioredoxin-dependent thiol peroxidase [Savagea sp. SN6]|uniref:thioredoxin-dependent peroxiredoxin n=1 Tax=Savagea serpentis TaxID=2785297 RepID=A0A8J7GLD9_9BACL|nr:thioredoxin-dependent thiol peroxidase [Savagea serpentis]MBF4502205.1 thioredoxin-dependent thiol peroxidase [Savagea serpentis]
MSLVGKQAPTFTLNNQQGEAVSLEKFKGKYVVLYFYPKDATPGCTTQACDFRDSIEDFTSLNAVILGVSPDNEASHQKFIAKHELPFDLLVDEEKRVAEAYDVWKLKKNFGREYMGIERSTFLIDPEGKVVKEWRKVRVKDHIEDALNTLKEMVNA